MNTRTSQWLLAGIFVLALAVLVAPNIYSATAQNLLSEEVLLQQARQQATKIGIPNGGLENTKLMSFTAYQNMRGTAYRIDTRSAPPPVYVYRVYGHIINPILYGVSAGEVFQALEITLDAETGNMISVVAYPDSTILMNLEQASTNTVRGMPPLIPTLAPIEDGDDD